MKLAKNLIEDAISDYFNMILFGLCKHLIKFLTEGWTLFLVDMESTFGNTFMAYLHTVCFVIRLEIFLFGIIEPSGMPKLSINKYYGTINQ